ncbi:MAG: HlyD family secretion protein [Thermodesulfobacteriota bacterium]
MNDAAKRNAPQASVARLVGSRKFWWSLVLFGVVGLLGWHFFWQRGDTALHASGTVEGVEVEITSKVAGRIATICCREGEMVKAGDVVVQLASEDLVAAVEQAAAEIASAEAELRRARAQEVEARRNRDRYTDLYRKSAVAKATYDAVVTAYATAAATTGAAQARLAAVQANRRYAEAKWADTIIRSPLDGMVVFRALEEGETVTPGVTILTVVDQQRLFVRSDLDERLLGRIAVGDPATITAEGLPGQFFPGKVSEISRYGEFATQRDVVRGRQDLRTFKMRLALGEHGGRLSPGMTVEVSIPARGGNGR